MNMKIDESANKVIEAILKRGNDVVIRRKKDGIVILEEKKTIQYEACEIGHE